MVVVVVVEVEGWYIVGCWGGRVGVVRCWDVGVVDGSGEMTREDSSASQACQSTVCLPLLPSPKPSPPLNPPQISGKTVFTLNTHI